MRGVPRPHEFIELRGLASTHGIALQPDGSDRRAFDVVTNAIGSKSAELNAVAIKVGSIDTLDRFLRDLRAGFADLAVKPPAEAAVPPKAAASATPAIGEPARP